MMKPFSRPAIQILFLIFFALATCAEVRALPGNCVVGTNVYYISQTGSDANSQQQALSKATPWKRAPYMASFGGNYSHSDGDCFVFRGGDTWVASDRMKILGGGTANTPAYYGVDQSWHAGSAWTRPVFDMQGVTSGSQDIIEFATDYVTWDNWEFIRAACSTSYSETIFAPDAKHGIKVINNYIHNFQSPVAGCGSGRLIVVLGQYGNPPCDGLFDHNVIDGSDGNKGYTAQGIIPNSCDPVTHNVIHDVCSAVNAYSHEVAYNLIYNVGPWGAGANYDCTNAGFHPDGIQTATDSDIHDNVMWNVTGEAVQVSPKTNPAHPVSHIYNNVLFSNTPTAIEIGTGGDPATSSGVLFINNNTLECDSAGNGGCIRALMGIANLTIMNNHYITNSGGPEICLSSAPFNNSGCQGVITLVYSPSTELAQTMAQAKSAGYSASQQYAYSPTSASSPTVGIGTNLQSTCTTSLLFCTDTSYGATTVGGAPTINGRSPVSRPGVGKWDVGAYAYGAGSQGSLAPPSGLAAALN
jgi:hypothetical protein